MEFVQRLFERLGKASDMLMAYPDLFIVAIAVAAVAAWWLRNVIGKGEVAGLTARIGALEERLRLASDKFQTMAEEKARLEQEVRKLDAQIDEKMPVYALTQTSAKAVASLGKLDELEREVAHSLGRIPILRDRPPERSQFDH
jgi:hypothetical protein